MSNYIISPYLGSHAGILLQLVLALHEGLEAASYNAHSLHAMGFLDKMC